MSEDLYKTMLYYDRGGVAKVDAGHGIELRVTLPHMPPIAGLPKHVTEMSVYPLLRDYRLRESANQMREMLPPEREAVIKFLNSIAEFGRRLFGGQA